MTSKIHHLRDFEPTVLSVTGVTHVKNPYGGSYILDTPCGKQIWANQKVNKFIKDTNEHVPFSLEIFEKKTFTNDEGKDITFVPTNCLTCTYA